MVQVETKSSSKGLTDLGKIIELQREELEKKYGRYLTRETKDKN